MTLSVIKTRNRIAKWRGSALAEVLLSLSLVMAVVALVAGIFPYSYTADQKAWRQSSAHRLAGTTLEQLRSQSFENLTGSSTTVMVEEVPYVVEVTVTNSTLTPTKAKNVVCRVTWSTPSGRESHTLEARIAKFQRGDEP